MQVEWRDILGYEGMYQVSNLGNIMNLERKVLGPFGSQRTIKQRVRRPQIKKSGYHISNLCGPTGTKCFSVHQLVAQAFIPDFIKGMEINHIDGNPGNNCLSNLEISNPSHNQLHAVRTGLKAKTGVSSSYRYITFLKNPRAVNKWACCIRHQGNGSYGWKTFSTELEAAQYADQLLDSIGDTERLRNFP